MTLRVLVVKPDDIQIGDIIDLADEPHRGRRFEEVDMRVIVDDCVHIFFKGWGYPVAISRTGPPCPPDVDWQSWDGVQVIRDVE
jgi:hypothetical protein